MSDNWSWGNYSVRIRVLKARKRKLLCAQCGGHFETWFSGVDYCSSECRLRRRAALRAAQPACGDAAAERRKAHYRAIYADARRGHQLRTVYGGAPAPRILLETSQDVDPALRARPCVECGRLFGCINGRVVCCTKECQLRRHARRERVRRAGMPKSPRAHEKPCIECGERFSTEISRVVCCSKRCHNRRHAAQERERRARQREGLVQ